MLFNFFYILFFVISVRINRCTTQKVTYIEMQGPVPTFVNRNYVKNLTVFSKRFGKNPLYFMTVTGTLLVDLDSTTELHFYAYEKLLNGYKRSFVEVHVNFCDYLNEDGIFSKIFLPPSITDILKCPLKPGNYSIENMTTPFGPYLNGFPFTEGRLYLNITYKVTNTMFSGYTNINIKDMKRNMFYKYMKEIRP